MNQVLQILEAHPFAGIRLREGQDAILAMSTLNTVQKVLFQGPAVLALSKHHQSDQYRDYVQTFKAFELYDIENVYIAQSSLGQFNLSDDDLILNAELLDDPATQQLCDNADVIQRY